MINSKMLGSCLLLVGTCVGAGMLALPVVSSPIGLGFSLMLLFICWAVMHISALFVLEVNLQLPEAASFTSMAEKTLGKGGKYFAWLAYLLLLYSLIAAYLAGGSDILQQIAEHWAINSPALPSMTFSMIWVGVMGLFMMFGFGCLDMINRGLMTGLIVSFCGLVVVMHNYVSDLSLSVLKISPVPIKHFFHILPVVVTAFGYHVIIPSLRYYLKSDSQSLVRICFWGSLIPLGIYMLWEFHVFSVIPQFGGEQTLDHILMQGHIASGLSHALAARLHKPWVVLLAEFFMGFALISSFIGIALSLFDFLADACQVGATFKGRFLLVVLTLLPPFLYQIIYPKGFILALSYGGVFVAILNAGLPAVMALILRLRRLKQPCHYQVPCGNVTIVGVIGFALVVVVVQFLPLLMKELV